MFLPITLAAYPLVGAFVLFGGGALPWFRTLYRNQTGSTKGWTVFATAHVVGGAALFVCLVSLPFELQMGVSRILLAYFVGLLLTVGLRALR